MSLDSYTLQTLIAAAYSALNEKQNMPDEQFSQAEIIKWLNTAQKEICAYTECLELSETVAIVSGQANYSLPANWFKTRKIQYKGSINKLLEFVDESSYLDISIIPSGSLITNYTIINNEMYLYPTPSGSTDTYLHLYVGIPDKLVNLTDVPFNGLSRLIPYHQLIADFAVLFALGKETVTPAREIIAGFTPHMQKMKNGLSSTRKAASAQFKRTYPSGGSRPPYPRLPSNY